MYFSEWKKILEERIIKVKEKQKSKKNSEKDYEHYPMELT